MLHPSNVAARHVRSWLGIIAAVLQLAGLSRAQELEPRAYSISPRGTNFAVLAFTRSSGDLTFDPSLAIENATAALHAAAFGYTRTIGFAGRSASVGLATPYYWGSVEGLLGRSMLLLRRSGLGDPAFRFAVNLHGAPAMNLAEFRNYRQKTNIGASVVVVAPLGQYDPRRLLNIGSNRWAARPEAGISQRVGRWYFDLYLGSWLFTANRNFLGRVRRQDPIGEAQLHVSCNMSQRVWAAFNANLYAGGRTSVGSIRRADFRRNSRMGGTISIRVTPRQSIKFTGSAGVVTNIGAAFVSIGMAYQYLWGGGL